MRGHRSHHVDMVHGPVSVSVPWRANANRDGAMARALGDQAVLSAHVDWIPDKDTRMTAKLRKIDALIQATEDRILLRLLNRAWWREWFRLQA